MDPDSDSFITTSQMRRQRMGAGIAVIVGKHRHVVIASFVVDYRVVNFLDHGGMMKGLVVHDLGVDRLMVDDLGVDRLVVHRHVVEGLVVHWDVVGGDVRVVGGGVVDVVGDWVQVPLPDRVVVDVVAVVFLPEPNCHPDGEDYEAYDYYEPEPAPI